MTDATAFREIEPLIQQHGGSAPIALPEAAVQVLLREHEYITHSLLNNRQKGVTRFNLFVALVGGALAMLGLKDGALADSNGSVGGVVVAVALIFLVITGWLMLLTLIRRSITTDRHLKAIQDIRDAIVDIHEKMDCLPKLDRGFELRKWDYYGGGKQCEPDLNAYKRMRNVVVSNFTPNYGDLIENLCAINSMIVAFPFARYVYIFFDGAIYLGIVAFALVCFCTWVLQHLYICYKHFVFQCEVTSGAALPGEYRKEEWRVWLVMAATVAASLLAMLLFLAVACELTDKSFVAALLWWRGGGTSLGGSLALCWV